jgi:hypothetical protein
MTRLQKKMVLKSVIDWEVCKKVSLHAIARVEGKIH